MTAPAETAAAILHDLAGEDREFGVSCPWNCSGDSRGVGHADDCPWSRALAFVSRQFGGSLA